MTDAEADQAAWTVWADANGGGKTAPELVAKVGGARAIALALAVGRDAAWPLLAWKVPGIAWLLDRVYAVIAANRHRVPGESPWCEQHPAECASPAP